MERAVIALSRVSLLLVLLAAAAAYSARDAVGEALLQRALSEQRGLSCSRAQVRVAASLNRVWLAPLRCRLSTGPVRAFETGNTEIRLLRLTVRSAALESATIDYRSRELSHLKPSVVANHGQGAQPRGLRPLREALLGVILDASEMYYADAPSIDVSSLTLKREGRIQLVMHGFKKSMDGSWDRSRAQRVELAVVPGSTVLVEALDMRVMPSWAKLSATLSLGPPSPAQRYELQLEGRRLDGPRPRVVTELATLVQASSRLL